MTLVRQGSAAKLSGLPYPVIAQYAVGKVFECLAHLIDHVFVELADLLKRVDAHGVQLARNGRPYALYLGEVADLVFLGDPQLGLALVFILELLYLKAKVLNFRAQLFRFGPQLVQFPPQLRFPFLLFFQFPGRLPCFCL